MVERRNTIPILSNVLIEAGDEPLGRFLRHVDLLKVRWDSTDLDLTAAETEALAALVRRAGPQRVVLERADSEAAIDFAKRIGVHLLQGFGVTAHVQAQHDKERDRTVARVRRAARLEPEKQDAPPRSTLRKLFRL